ncbi:MAG: hypothetical protein M3680_21715 [Myxococcota bacterium]|nr:hypothetical protein [Myxococcota bacterium]
MNQPPDVQRASHGRTLCRCGARTNRSRSHDLLDVSRITRGTFELRTEHLDLRQPIEAAIEATAPLTG